MVACCTELARDLCGIWNFIRRAARTAHSCRSVISWGTRDTNCVICSSLLSRFTDLACRLIDVRNFALSTLRAIVAGGAKVTRITGGAIAHACLVTTRTRLVPSALFGFMIPVCTFAFVGC